MSEMFPYSFGKYRVEARIGRGGFGTVFRAVDVALDRVVALKILDPIYLRDTHWVGRFRQEARLMARLDHHHIVPIYEINEEQGRLYLAMKFIDGPDLTQLIKEQQKLDWDVVLKLTGQIAAALDYAHQQGIIHRDLKPDNILTSNGDALLTDFGLAQLVQSNKESITVSGGFTGTYNYMPPEIFNNEPSTPSSDVYALGCVVYEMVTGHMLLEDMSPAAIIGAHLKGISVDEELPEGTPPGTRAIIQTALAKDPRDRYAAAGEMARELQRVTEDRFTNYYAQLEQALAKERWPEALALAAEIRKLDAHYRDVEALEKRAQRGRWCAHWQVEAQQALARDDFDAARGALAQWRLVDKEDQRISQVERELGLAEQYVALQALMAEGQRSRAEKTAEAISEHDPAYRDTADLQETNGSNLSPSPRPEDVIFKPGEDVHAVVDDDEVQGPKPVPKGSIWSQIPAWARWAGGVVLLLGLAWGLRAVFFPDNNQIATPVPATAAPATAAIPSAGEAVQEQTVVVVSWFTQGVDAQALAALVGVFRQQYPHITFDNPEAGREPDVSFSFWEEQLAAGDVPDSWQAHAGEEVIQRYVPAKLLEPLNFLYKKYGWYDVLPEVLLDSISEGGNQISVPVNIHRSNVLWANPQVLAGHGLEMPANLDEWFAAMDIIQDEGLVVPLALGEQWTAAHLFETILLASLGPEGYVKLWDGGNDWSGADVAQAIANYEKVLSYTNSDATNLSWEDAAHKVVNGDAAFNVMGDWQEGFYRGMKMAPYEDYIWAPVPGTAGSFQFLADCFVLAVGAPNRDAAIAWLTVVGSRAGQDAFNPIKGSIPPRSDADVSLYGPYQQSAMKDWVNDILVGSFQHGSLANDNWRAEINDAVGAFLQTGDKAAFQKALVSACASSSACR